MRDVEAGGSTAGVDALLGDAAREHGRGVEVGEGRRRRRVGQVVGGHVDRLHRRDRPLGGGGDALLQRTRDPSPASAGSPPPRGCARAGGDLGLAW